MLGVIKDPAMVVLALIVTGLEEAIMRCTIVHRDNLMRWVQGFKQQSAEELALEREIWSVASAVSMCHEITSIITSRVQFLVFRQHRFVFNVRIKSQRDYAEPNFARNN